PALGHATRHPPHHPERRPHRTSRRRLHRQVRHQSRRMRRHPGPPHPLHRHPGRLQPARPRPPPHHHLPAPRRPTGAGGPTARRVGTHARLPRPLLHPLPPLLHHPRRTPSSERTLRSHRGGHPRTPASLRGGH